MSEIIVKAKRDRWRAGHKFARGNNTIEAGKFTQKELKAIDADPVLTILKEDPPKKPKASGERKSAAQKRAEEKTAKEAAERKSKIVEGLKDEPKDLPLEKAIEKLGFEITAEELAEVLNPEPSK